MRSISRLLLVGLAVTSIGLAGCGDDDSGEAADESTSSSSSTSTTEAESFDTPIEEYCARAQDYIDAVQSVDITTVASTIEGFELAAEAARAAADVAPEEVKTANEQIASAAEDLIEGIKDRDPKTMTELDAGNTELVEELEAEYGDLDDEVAQFQEFATRECGTAPE